MAAMYADARVASRHTTGSRVAAQKRELVMRAYLVGTSTVACAGRPPPAMRCTWFAILLVVVTGCHLRAGFDAASRSTGPLHSVMSASTVSRSDGVINLPPANGRNYALEAGFGNATFTFNGLLAVHDVTSTSFTPGAGYLTATLGGNVRWSMFRWKGLSPSLGAGPVRMMLLDRATGERTWGNGLRFGAGAQYRLGPVAIYGDIYREVVAFGGGAAQGTTALDGLTLGLALQP